MNLLSLIQELIDEGKQVGVLYHYTTPENFRKIMETDRMEGSKDLSYYTPNPRRQTGHLLGTESVSFTRNKYFHRDNRFTTLGLSKDNGRPSVRIAVDGDKLSQKFKVVPFRYFHDDPRINRTSNTDEHETRVLVDTIPRFSDYLLKVDDIWKEVPVWRNKVPFYVDPQTDKIHDATDGREIGGHVRYSAEWIEVLPPRK